MHFGDRPTDAEIDARAQPQLPDPARAYAAATRDPVERKVLVELSPIPVGNDTPPPAFRVAQEFEYRLAYYDGGPDTPADCVLVESRKIHKGPMTATVERWARWERVR